MYVCIMYVCMYVYMCFYVCMYVCMYVSVVTRDILPHPLTSYFSCISSLQRADAHRTRTFLSKQQAQTDTGTQCVLLPATTRLRSLFVFSACCPLHRKKEQGLLFQRTFCVTTLQLVEQLTDFIQI
jgi:hypothetical protein